MSLRHRLFAYLLLFRAPLQSEVGDIDTAIASARRQWGWLALIYVGALGITVWPAFARAHGLPYQIIAVLCTHLLLWFGAWVVATSWVGFRVIQEDAAPAPGAFLPLVGIPAMLAVILLHPDHKHWADAFKSWWNEHVLSFPILLLMFLTAATTIPQVVARLRRNELAAVARALAAEAAGEKLARKTAEADLRLLQAQIEPHFLYNTLANLRYLIQKNSPDALRMTDVLIEYLRTSVPDIRALRVPLGRETDHARHYLEIMQMRMGARLAFTIDVPDTLRAIEVPPLLLLTLVENAVKHGIAPQIEGGEVVLRAREDGAAIEVEVVDTGVGVSTAADKPADAPSTGVGLENLRGRLQLAYGKEVALELRPNTPRGTLVHLRLPREMPRAETVAAGAQVLVLTEEAARNARLIPDKGGDR